MPLYALQCEAGHGGEAFEHHADDLGSRTAICSCGGSMAVVLSVGRGLTYFEEGRARVIHNLGHEPVVVRSHEEHKRRMREAGVDWATAGRGRKGQWV